MRDGVRWAAVIAFNFLAFAGVFVLCYAVRAPLLPSAEEGRIAVGVAAATVVATIGGTAGASWVSRSAARAQPRPVSAEPDSGPGEPARVLVRMGELPLEPRGFQPRADLLATLEQAADEPGLTVVHAVTGARGVGKTQLAAAYARSRIRDGWPVVAWLTAESGGRLASGLAELADRLGVRSSGDDVEAAARSALGWFGGHPDLPCLIVVDNATDPDEVAAWLPTAGRAQVVVTTTVRSFGNIAGAQVDVDVFTAVEALDFLAKRSGCGADDGAAELAAELGYLPLALAQAAEVIRGRGGGCLGYLERLRAYPVHEVLARVPGERYPHRVAEAILLAVEEVEGRSGGEGGLVRLLLEMLSVLAPGGVPRELLHGALESSGGPYDASAVDDALGVLADVSLITRVGDDAVAVHRLVQRVLRERARQEGKLDGAADLVVRHLDVLLVPPEDAWRKRERGRRLADQVEALWVALGPEIEERGAVAMRPVLKLRSWAANEYLAEVGDLARALDMARGIVEVCEATADASDPVTLSAMKRFFSGSLHPALVRARRRSGTYYASLGRVRKNAAVQRRLLDDLTREFGPDHPWTLRRRTSWAESGLRYTGHWRKALTLLRELAADHERLFGADHPWTLGARADVVRIARRTGRLRTASAEYAALVADRERIHGPDHFWTWQTRVGHAFTLLLSSHPHRAVVLYDRLLRDAARVFGPASHQARWIAPRYTLICFCTGHWTRLREARRVLRGE
ncbi:tetratricopeptide repeat protein [Streptomyces sp. NPDC041068]|uniref:tetratricopeptide repeat protein n=1 Tax=Streptomyces sp. NPDC041068 TaxID=3155130 RepID=UPI0033E7C9A8